MAQLIWSPQAIGDLDASEKIGLISSRFVTARDCYHKRWTASPASAAVR